MLPVDSFLEEKCVIPLIDQLQPSEKTHIVLLVLMAGSESQQEEKGLAVCIKGGKQ